MAHGTSGFKMQLLNQRLLSLLYICVLTQRNRTLTFEGSYVLPATAQDRDRNRASASGIFYFLQIFEQQKEHGNMGNFLL